MFIADYKSLLLQGIAFCYFFAFYSIYTQWEPLFGVDGIQPVDSWFHPSSFSIASNVTNNFLIYDFLNCFKNVKTLGCISNSNYNNVHVDFVLELCGLLGVVLSGITVTHFQLLKNLRLTSIVFFICWLLYLSLFSVGKVFLNFQWDVLLLETGFAAIIFALEGNDIVYGDLLFRTILFKLMFMSGAVKLQSQCPTWWSLTALDYHFATQCLPTPFAWYAHQLPTWMKRIGVGFTLLVEGPLTFLVFSPFKSHQRLYAKLLLLLMSGIMLTGNYNFFNLLTIVISIPLWECTKNIKVESYRLIKISGALYVGASILFYFDLIFSGDMKPWSLRMFNLEKHIETALICIFFMALVHITARSIHMAASLVTKLKLRKDSSRIRFVVKGLTEVVYFIIKLLFNLVYLAMILFPMLTLHRPALINIQQRFEEAFTLNLVDAYMTFNSVGISSQYGLFRTMTGTDENPGSYPSVVMRPEIYFEILLVKNISDQNEALEGIWIDLDFPSKPNEIQSDSLHWVAPLQPRFDWQLWFAALGDYQSSPWLIHFVDKILSGSQKVLKLLSSTMLQKLNERFADGYQIQAIKASRKYTDFTRIKSQSLLYDNELKYLKTQEDSFNTKHTWYYKIVNSTVAVEEYLPVLEKGNDSVLHFLKHHGWDRFRETDDNIRAAQNCGSFQLLCSIIVECRGRAITISLQLIVALYCIRIDYIYDAIKKVLRYSTGRMLSMIQSL